MATSVLQEKVPHPNRSVLETSCDAIKKVMLVKCCPNLCLKTFGYREIKECRQLYWEMNGKRQRRFIYTNLKSSTVDGATFIIHNKESCELAWRSIHGVCERRYRDIKKTVKKGLPPPHISTTGSEIRLPSRPSRRHLQARTWFQEYVLMFAERQPDKEEYHLPQVLSKEMIYGLYKAEMQNVKEDVLSLSSFRDMWLQTFRNVKISTGKSGQPQCTPCTNIQSVLSMKLSKETRNAILAKRTIHLDLQALCRAKYYKHIKKAKEQPEKYCSIIIDNMDQAKTKLPGFAMQSKVDAHLNKMQHHVTGVKVHQLDKTVILTWTDLFHPDVNITINSLVYVLKEVCRSNNGMMPPTLYLQADNSGKDNKNAFLMAFLAWLVKEKVFKKIKVGFLMVGHTHEDIDQVFSRISVCMHRTDAPTLPRLHEAIEKSTTKPPETVQLTSIFDYKKELEHCRGLIVGISGPHQFVIKEINGKITLRYKDWPKDEENYRQVDLTEATNGVDFENLDPVPPNPKIEENITRMNNDIQKWGQIGRLNQEEIEWWIEYLRNLKSKAANNPSISKATELNKFKDPQIQNSEVECTNLKEAIHSAADKENRVSQLKVRGQKRKRAN